MKNHQIIVSQWLEQFKKERDISLLLEEGYWLINGIDELNCIVEVPEDLTVPTVFIYLPLVPLSPASDSQLSLITNELEINLFGLLTGGCQIALDDRFNSIVLSFSAVIDTMNGDTFQHILNNMLKIAPRLRQRLRNTVAPSSLASKAHITRHHPGDFVPVSS